MALLKCPDCGKEFSDQAAACPNCGRPNAPREAPKKAGCATWGCLTIIVLGVIASVVGGPDGGTTAKPTYVGGGSAEPFVSQSAAKEAVRQQLRDPESARFSGVYVHRGPSGAAVCGRVNAKNGFGGYTGDSDFFVIGSAAVLETDENRRQFTGLYKAACTDAPVAKPGKPSTSR